MHHNNFYFIRRLSEELKNLLSGSVLYDCYSQNKDELVLAFILPDKEEFYIVCNLGTEFSSLYFPVEFNRARRNSITLFQDLLGLEVNGVIQYENERAFGIQFENNFQLVFKLFGNRANIILYHDNRLVHIFKSNLKQDKNFIPRDRGLDVSFENLKQKEFDLNKVFFTFDALFLQYFEKKGYSNKSEEQKYQIIKDTLGYLNSSQFYITKIKDKVVLSLFSLGEIMEEFSSPLLAINAFYSAHYKYNFLDSRKTKVLHQIAVSLNSRRSYLERASQKLSDLERERSPSEYADIIMANLHKVPAGAHKVLLYDFYSGNDLEIKLKKDLSPQKNAELLYKKAKKKPMEIENLEGQITLKEAQLKELEHDISLIEKIASHKELEPFELKYCNSKLKEESDLSEKFKTYEVMGFLIFVGRNAGNNDELTQKFAHKNDLWLHAKDVAGSHVVIRHQAGKKFPKPVIEAAASIAAFYSKRKNETLCPVIYTEKKYVRKVKGAPKGAVKVEKETVIMVPPKDIGVS